MSESLEILDLLDESMREPVCVVDDSLGVQVSLVLKSGQKPPSGSTKRNMLKDFKKFLKRFKGLAGFGSLLHENEIFEFDYDILPNLNLIVRATGDVEVSADVDLTDEQKRHIAMVAGDLMMRYGIKVLVLDRMQR